MNKSLALVTIAAVALLIGLGVQTFDVSEQLSLRKNLQVPVTVPYVDVNQYLGVWYEQAVIPFYFERGCSKTFATYSLNTDKTIKVNNTCTRNGRPTSSIGKAIAEDSTNSKLKVEFIQTLDIGGQYWIVRLGENYSYSVVSSPDYKYLWILSRVQNMPETLYQSIIADLKKDNFPVEKLVRTQQ